MKEKKRRLKMEGALEGKASLYIPDTGSCAGSDAGTEAEGCGLVGKGHLGMVPSSVGGYFSFENPHLFFMTRLPWTPTESGASPRPHAVNFLVTIFY